MLQPDGIEPKDSKRRELQTFNVRLLKRERNIVVERDDYRVIHEDLLSLRVKVRPRGWVLFGGGLGHEGIEVGVAVADVVVRFSRTKECRQQALWIRIVSAPVKLVTCECFR